MQQTHARGSRRRLGGPVPLAQANSTTVPGFSWVREIPQRLTARRPAIAWSLSLLFAFKGLICLVVVISPISASEPTRLLGVIGAIALLAGLAVWLWGERIPAANYPLFAALGAVTASALVARSNTHGGMMVTAFSYPWIAIYAAHFFERRVVILMGSLITVGFGVGLAIDGLSNAGVYWVVVTATTWSICLVLGQLSESLRHQAGTDPLTGLLNRNAFLEAANRERSIADRTGAPLVLAVLDLDDFKRVNDSDGHAAGDRVLASLAHTWQECLRGGDVLARHGGDEFVLLLPASTAATARTTLERMREAETSIGWSAGISEWLAGEPLDACLARADRYLYAVKESARTTAGEPSERLSTELIG